MATIAELGPRIGVGRTAEVFALGDDRIVKLFYPNIDERFIQNEARAGELVSKAGLPVPGFHRSMEFDGRAGIVLERLRGETILQLLRRRPWEILQLMRQFASLHRELHQCEIPELRPYRDVLAMQIQNAPGLAEADKNRLHDHLQDLPLDRQMVCHGDFHPDNIMLTSRGPVVIDWMAACSGEPAADVARTVLLLSIGTPTEMDVVARMMITVMRRLVLNRYKAYYFRDSDLARSRVMDWLPVIAAARLVEGIENETEQLLTLTGLQTNS